MKTKLKMAALTVVIAMIAIILTNEYLLDLGTEKALATTNLEAQHLLEATKEASGYILGTTEDGASHIASVPTPEITDPVGTLARAIECVEASKTVEDKLLDKMFEEYSNIKDGTYKGMGAEEARFGINLLIRESYWMLNIEQICEETGVEALKLMEID